MLTVCFSYFVLLVVLSSCILLLTCLTSYLLLFLLRASCFLLFLFLTSSSSYSLRLSLLASLTSYASYCLPPTPLPPYSLRFLILMSECVLLTCRTSCFLLVLIDYFLLFFRCASFGSYFLLRTSYFLLFLLLIPYSSHRLLLTVPT